MRLFPSENCNLDTADRKPPPRSHTQDYVRDHNNGMISSCFLTKTKLMAHSNNLSDNFVASALPYTVAQDDDLIICNCHCTLNYHR